MSRHHLSVLVCVSILTIVVGCNTRTEQTPQRPARACDSLAVATARGSNDREVAESRRAVENRRVGCDDAVRFMVLLGSTMFESGVSLETNQAINYGLTWCSAQFQNIQNRKEGCEIGVRESVVFTHGVTALLHIRPSQNPSNSAAQEAAGPLNPEQAYQRAQFMAARISRGRQETLTAQASIERAIESARLLGELTTQENAAQAQALAAVNRATNMRARAGQIAADLHQAQMAAQQVAAQRLQIQSRLNPLENEFNLASNVEMAAQQHYENADASLRHILTEIQSVQAATAAALADAQNMRNDIPNLRAQADRLHDEASRVRSATP